MFFQKMEARTPLSLVSLHMEMSDVADSDSIYCHAITGAGIGAAAALDAERLLSKEALWNEEAEYEAELLSETMAEDGAIVF